jgi:hypothetical protein
MMLGLKIVAIVMLALLVIIVAHEIYSPYMSWYFLVPGARLTVDDRPEHGWLHRSRHGRVLFLTRQGKEKNESYEIWIPRDERGSVMSCGEWTAPEFFVFSIGDVNPPCLTLSLRFIPNDGPPPKSTGPRRNLVAGPGHVEFTADDGSRLKVSW